MSSFICAVHAQEADSSSSQEIELFSLGLGIGGSNIGLAAQYDASYLVGDSRFSIRFMETMEIPLIFSGTFPDEIMQEIALLFSPMNYKDETTFISASAGIGLVRGVKRGIFLYRSTDFLGESDHYEGIRISTVGLAFEVRLHNAVFSFLGVSLKGFGNLNKDKPLLGVLFSVDFGKLR